MLYAILISVVFILILAIVYLLQAYITQRDTIFSIRNLVDHLLHGRQTRRVPSCRSGRNRPGRVARRDRRPPIVRSARCCSIPATAWCCTRW